MAFKGSTPSSSPSPSKDFSSPVPVIGLYIAAASLICTLAMAADIFAGFRRKRSWFPCTYFKLNALSLTLLGIALKLPVDLTTEMPGKVDQLAKLGSTAFMCMAMANFMPSVEPLAAKEVPSNLIALGIMAITIIVNVCIQLGTGLIYELKAEHAIIMFFMLVLLLHSTFSSFALPAIVNDLESNERRSFGFFKNTISSLPREGSTKDELDLEIYLRNYLMQVRGSNSFEKLLNYVKRFWIVSEIQNPQFVIVRLVTCKAAGIVCILTALTLLEAEVRVFVSQGHEQVYGSDYKFSNVLILAVQSIGVVLGTVAPVLRRFASVDYVVSEEGCQTQIRNFKYHDLFKLMLGGIEYKFFSSATGVLIFMNPQGVCRMTCGFIFGMIISAIVHIPILFGSICCQFISIVLLELPFSYCHLCIKRLCSKLHFSHPNEPTTSDPESGFGDQCRDSFLEMKYDLENDNILQQGILRGSSYAADQLFHKAKQVARSKDYRLMVDFLDRYRSHKFFGLLGSYNEDAPSSTWSWTLFVLGTIASAVSHGHSQYDNIPLKSIISECLKYTFHIEATLSKGSLIEDLKVQALLSRVTITDDLWFGINMLEIVGKSKSSSDTIRKLARIAEDYASKSGEHQGYAAARICEAVLLNIRDNTNTRNGSDNINEIIEKLYTMIADTMAACYTIVLFSILDQNYEKGPDYPYKEGELIQFLGATDEIFHMLLHDKFPDLDTNNVQDIQNWQMALKRQRRGTENFKIFSSLSISKGVDEDNSSPGGLAIHDAQCITMFKGESPGGEQVVVQTLADRKISHFVKEIIISKFQHPNLNHICGCCVDEDKIAILYQSKPSLDLFLFDPSKNELLDWEARFRIITGIAQGLHFLHNNSIGTVIHGALQYKNVLLDQNMKTQIANFADAIFLGQKDIEICKPDHKTRFLEAPEVCNAGKFSIKSDSFSFGVLILGIISGKEVKNSEDLNLLRSLMPQELDERVALEFKDQSLGVAEEDIEQILLTIKVGLFCTNDDASERPDMAKVLSMLHQL